MRTLDAIRGYLRMCFPLDAMVLESLFGRLDVAATDYFWSGTWGVLGGFDMVVLVGTSA